MPTDISGAVEPEYTETLPVPLDGEYANSTALQNMVLPLANRIEYVRALVQEQPWIRGGFFDDFGMDFRVIDSASLTYMADTPWFADDTPANNGFGQVINVSDSSGYGVVRHRNSGGGVAEHIWRKSAALMPWAPVRRFGIRVCANSIASGMICDIGVTSSVSFAEGDDGDNCLMFHFDPASSANWQLRTDNGAAVSTLAPSGVPVVAGTWYTLECLYDGTTASLYIDGVFQFSTNTTLPNTVGTQCTYKIGLLTPNSGASREWILDWAFLDCDFAGRAV